MDAAQILNSEDKGPPFSPLHQKGAGVKIAVNTRLLLRDKLEGIGYFAYETLIRITKSHPNVEFHFLFDRPYDPAFVFSDNVKPVVLFPPARHPFLWYWWFEWSVARYLHREQFDLFLSPDGYCSLRSATPTLAVQHDIAFEHYPQFVPALYNLYYRHYVPEFMYHAARIATVSEFSKADIVSRYDISPDKIDVVYNAAKDVFKPISPEAKKSIKEKYAGGRDYLIYVGSINPRKNLKNMLLGFEQFKSNHLSSDLQFLVAGAFGWQNSELKSIMDGMKYRDQVIFLGRQPESELALLIAGSFALMYLSLFEGFGVPPIEAMACGVPVIASDTSSLPEICGDAALLVQPSDINVISAAIDRLSSDHAMRETYISRGYVQASKYSWDRSAALLWESCLKAIG